MFKSKVKIADILVSIESEMWHLHGLCENYLYDFVEPEIDISISKEMIEYENNGIIPNSKTQIAICESAAALRYFNDLLINYDAFIFHGASFKVAEKGIILCAKSGTGKTTHMNLWHKMLGDNFLVINGDKPIIRFLDGCPYSFGSPWNGKEHLHNNIKAKLTDICFIERSSINEVVKLEGPEIAQRLSSQMAQSQNPEVLFKNMEFIELLKKNCNFYIIRCNMEIEAAQVAYKAIFGKEYTDG